MDTPYRDKKVVGVFVITFFVRRFTALTFHLNLWQQSLQNHAVIFTSSGLLGQLL
jgi:hypothetical protein